MWSVVISTGTTSGAGKASEMSTVLINPATSWSDSEDNTIFSPDRTVGLVGLKNVVVVDSGDAILVCARDRVQQVRKIVDILKEKGKEELL